MGRALPYFELDLDLTSEARRSAEGLYRELKSAIADGRLKAGTRLPPMRLGKAFFGLSRNTVADAYERLRNEGLAESRQGSGTIVARRVPGPPPLRSGAEPIDRRLNEHWLSGEVASAMGFWQEEGPAPAPRSARAAAPTADFRPALIDSRLFPLDVLRRITVKQLRTLEQRPPTFRSPQGNQGNFGLRDAVTRHISLTRAVACNPEDILVTSGAQQAFDLIARVLVKAGETVVAVENPGYPPLRVPFAAAGARIVPVGVDSQGLIVEQLPPAARIICVSPSHHFPLGVTLSKQRRERLIEFARARGAVIVEDDYDGEFRLDGGPLAALRTAEAADVTFYVGTFSKCMLPALRLGFIVAPDWAMRALVVAKNATDWHCATPLQMAVSAFIREGHLARHLRKMRQLYKQRRQLLMDRLQRDFREWFEPIPSFYGTHLTALARTPLDLERVGRLLAERDVKIHTLSRYFLGPPSTAGLVFGFGAADREAIGRGLSVLRRTLSE